MSNDGKIDPKPSGNNANDDTAVSSLRFIVYMNKIFLGGKTGSRYIKGNTK